MTAERRTGQEYKPSVKTRLLLAFEDWLIRRAESQNRPETKKDPKKWLYIAVLTVGLPAFTAGSIEIFKPGAVNNGIADINRLLGHETECGPDKPLAAGNSMSIDRRYYVFNNVQGLTIQVNSCAIKNLLDSQKVKIELPGEEIAVITLSPQFVSENPDAFNNYFRSTISPRIREHHGEGKEGNFIGINVVKYIANTYGLSKDLNTSRVKLGQSLSLEWTLQLKKTVLKLQGKKAVDYLTEQEMNEVLANRPIDVVGVTPQLISQSITRYGAPAEAKVGQVEAMLQEGSLIVLEKEAIYNATPGFTGIIALDILQERLRDRDYAPDAPDNARLITVLLPSRSDNPAEFYKAQAEFKEKKLPEIMAKFPGLTAQVNPIPMGDFIKSAYQETTKGQLKEARYGEVEYDLTKAFFSVRKNYGTEVLARAYNERIFQVFSINDELINSFKN